MGGMRLSHLSRTQGYIGDDPQEANVLDGMNGRHERIVDYG
jgi:hypothetical protein